jgi:hypothetical protein
MKQKLELVKKEANVENEEIINFKPLKLGVLKVKIIGTSPYMPEPMDMDVVEKYDNKKAKKMFKADDESEADKVKKKLYLTDDGKIGIPSRSFYNAMIKVSSYLFEKQQGGMRNIREGITVRGEIIPLKFKKQQVLTHWGRNSGMTKAPRKIMRNAFYDWTCEVEIEYNKNNLSAEQILNVLNWAGFHIGVGAFRKEKTGNYGLFRVDVD